MNGLSELAAVLASRRADAAEIERLRFHVADTVAALVAATATTEGRALIRFRHGLRALPGGGANLFDDIALHSALARSSEVDDIHLASMTTPGAVVVPAGLLLAARLGTDDAATVAAAMLGGYEAMIRLGRVINGPAILYRGIWPTYFTAAFGTAAVTARLLRLSADQTAHALALAVTLSAPSVGQHHAETTARWLSVGQAARAGVTAAFAAHDEFTAEVAVLRSRFMPEIYGIEVDLNALTEDLDSAPAIADLSFKPWCAARQTMAATQALRDLVAEGIAPESITAISAAVLPPHAKMINHGVTAGERASFITSLPYQMAISLLQPDATLSLAPVAPSPAAQSLMSKITITPDHTLLRGYPKEWSAKVTVTTADGSREKLARHVPGDPARPMSAAHLQQKFRRLVTPIVGASADPLWHSALEAPDSVTACRTLVEELDRLTAE
jgi:2-methylcitrate dehydratase PrpD